MTVLRTAFFTAPSDLRADKHNRRLWRMSACEGMSVCGNSLVEMSSTCPPLASRCTVPWLRSHYRHHFLEHFPAHHLPERLHSFRYHPLSWKQLPLFSLLCVLYIYALPADEFGGKKKYIVRLINKVQCRYSYQVQRVVCVLLTNMRLSVGCSFLNKRFIYFYF